MAIGTSFTSIRVSWGQSDRIRRIFLAMAGALEATFTWISLVHQCRDNHLVMIGQNTSNGCCSVATGRLRIRSCALSARLWTWNHQIALSISVKLAVHSVRFAPISVENKKFDSQKFVCKCEPFCFTFHANVEVMRKLWPNYKLRLSNVPIRDCWCVDRDGRFFRKLV
jgi:hypothetical protein